jgi:PAS domain S-box-containing protein
MSGTEVTGPDLEGFLNGFKSADGLLCVDGRQRIVHWSASAERLLGYTASEVLGWPCYEVFGGRESQNHRFCRRDCPIIANARRGRPTVDYDVLARTKDGADIWVNVSILLMRPDRRQSPLIMHLMRDVTERRRVEELARRATDTLRELAAAPLASGEEGSSYVGPRPTPLPSLSKREMQVLQLMALGLRTREIADNLGVSPVTARNHITHVVSKLGATHRLQAVLYASGRGLI